MKRAFPLTNAMLAALAFGVALAAEPPRRAAPPSEWAPTVLDAFFDDARDALEGERPAAALPKDSRPIAANGDGHDAFEWSRLISADALATEVKRLAVALDEPLATNAAFQSGGHEQCRAVFSVLAALWAVIDEYDGDVRWQRDAAALRDACARDAANCRTASDQAFAAATERRAVLESLIRGEQVGGGGAGPVDAWSALSERGPLMKRMELGLLERINPRLSDARTFTRSAADVQHEAEMLALLAEVIRREEYEYWDDETFNEYAGELGAAAADLSRAAADKNYDAARAAAGRAGQACATCHDGYRE